METGKTFDLTKNNEILTIKSTQNSVGGPYCNEN
jgi:hypothetical protein